MEHIASIFTGLFSLVSAVIVAFFAYNQYTKNKITDAKIEKMKEENIERAARNNRHIATIHGML